MVVNVSPARRFEWKYRVPEESARELIVLLEPWTRPDPYGTGPEGRYSVYSVYYDTADLRFYHETRDGIRVRRKLRVRKYGGTEYFLEIKRKLNKKVVKERVLIPGAQFVAALDGVDPQSLMEGRSEGDLRTLERFRFNLKTLSLVPTLLVAYERRAMIGRAEPDLRVTLDHDLRGRTHPEATAPFEPGPLVAFESQHVLEIKFSGRPSRWLMDVVTQLQLRRGPYSKYCEGMDRCGAGGDAAERGATPGQTL